MIFPSWRVHPSSLTPHSSHPPSVVASYHHPESSCHLPVLNWRWVELEKHFLHFNNMNTYQRKVTDNSNMNKCWAWKLEDYTDYTIRCLFFRWRARNQAVTSPGIYYCCSNCSTTLWDLWCESISSSNKTIFFSHGFTSSSSHNPQKSPYPHPCSWVRRNPKFIALFLPSKHRQPQLLGQHRLTPVSLPALTEGSELPSGGWMSTTSVVGGCTVFCRVFGCNVWGRCVAKFLVAKYWKTKRVIGAFWSG